MKNKKKKTVCYSKKNEILVIELDTEVIRGVVVRKRGKNVSIIRAAQVLTVKAIPDVNPAYNHLFSQPRLNDETRHLEELFEKLGRYPRRAFVVSSDIKFLVSELPISTDTRISSAKLQEAVRWEAQTYLDFPVTDGLFGYYLQNGKSAYGQKTGVLISAVSREKYGRLSALFNRSGLELCGVIPAEGAFVFSVSSFSNKLKDRIVLNIDKDNNTVSGALLHGGGPAVFQTASLDNAGSLTERLASLTGGITEIVVTGRREKDIGEFCKDIVKKSSVPVRPWNPDKDIQVHPSVDAFSLSPQYSTAIGAALQAIGGGRCGELIVNDYVPFVKRLQTGIHILPLVMAVLVVCGMSVQYASMKASYSRYEQDILSLTEDKKRLKANVENNKKLEQEINDIIAKRKYVEETLPIQHARLVSLFEGIAREISYDIILDRIAQDGDKTFLLEGLGLSAGSITQFTGKLDRVEGVKEAKLEVISERENSQVSVELLYYKFRIKVTLL
ncbi:MAG: hypothetical protein K8S27_03045 [Candidatus Omnitrophica bacterium]|nr:hypothetical protein [Candidatus Omnitrophota bacterium]